MAEEMLRAKLGKTTWDVMSAGVSTSDGMPASRNSVAAMSEIGLDLTRHLSQELTPALIRAANLIVPMTRGHFADIIDRVPAAREKTLLMGSFLKGGSSDGDALNIDDPCGGTLGDYRQTRDDILRAITGLVAYLTTKADAF